MKDTSPQVSFEDTMILAYLRDSRHKRKGLKYLSKIELDREMIELTELFPPKAVKAKKLDFSTLDPGWEPVVWYAAPDAINTLALYHGLRDSVMERDEFGWSQKTIYKLEKACMLATLWMEECQIYIDRDKLETLIRLGHHEWWECVTDVYKSASDILGRDVRPEWFKEMGRVFNPDTVDPVFTEVRDSVIASSTELDLPLIPKEVKKVGNPKDRETVSFPHVYDVTIPQKLGLMMREMEIEGLVATEKTGQVKTNQETLDRVIDEAGDKFPFMKKIKRLREVAKGLGSYLFAIYWDSTPERAPEGRVRAAFNGFKVDTGRFATAAPKEKKKQFFHGQCRWMVHGTPATYDRSKPDCVRRIREVVAARPGWMLYAIDYSGVELRIVSNMSGEKKWLEEFFHCSGCDKQFPRDETPPSFCPECGSDKIGDIHSLTAVSIFGEGIKENPKEFKHKRNQSKGVNFGLCYGGGPSAVQRAVETGWDESCRIKNKFDSTFRTLQKWWKKQHLEARKQKYVLTAFGRKYPVPDIDHEYGNFRAKAERNSVNGPVQGTSADIMKLAMVLVHKLVKSKSWEDRVMLEITIHDELVFEIHNSIAEEAVGAIEKVMVKDTVKNLGWIVPLKVDVEFGPDWTVPCNLTEMSHNKGGGKWTPEFVSVFPNRYKSYLENGGTPVEGVEGYEGVKFLEPQRLNGTGPPPVTRFTPNDNREYDYVVADSLMTSGNAEKLAKVIKSCLGLGVDKVFLKDEDGNLLVSEPIVTSYPQFLTITEYEGITSV